MKTSFAFALLLAACSHSSEPKSPATTGAGNDTTQPMVDPTMPSWAPKSCVAYHKAVVEAVSCQEIDQAVRDSIKSKYEAANAAWHDLQSAPPNTINEIDLLCTENVTYVHSQGAGKCVATQ